MSYSLEELRGLPRGELVKGHDMMAEHTSIGVDYYLEELARRDRHEQTDQIIALTEQMATSSNEMAAISRFVARLSMAALVVSAMSVVIAVIALSGS